MSTSNALAQLKQNEIAQVDENSYQPGEEITYQQVTTFRIDGELYGIDVVCIKEVLRFSEVTPVPGTDSYVLGITNLRGNVLTVIDTRQLFNLPNSEVNEDTRIIVAELNDQEVIGLIVDSVDEVINLPSQSIDRAPNISGDETAKRFVMGVCYSDNRLIILLDLMKILNSIVPDDMPEEH